MKKLNKDFWNDKEQLETLLVIGIAAFLGVFCWMIYVDYIK